MEKRLTKSFNPRVIGLFAMGMLVVGQVEATMSKVEVGLHAFSDLSTDTQTVLLFSVLQDMPDNLTKLSQNRELETVVSKSLDDMIDSIPFVKILVEKTKDILDPNNRGNDDVMISYRICLGLDTVALIRSKTDPKLAKTKALLDSYSKALNYALKYAKQFILEDKKTFIDESPDAITSLLRGMLAKNPGITEDAVLNLIQDHTVKITISNAFQKQQTETPQNSLDIYELISRVEFNFDVLERHGTYQEIVCKSQRGQAAIKELRDLARDLAAKRRELQPNLDPEVTQIQKQLANWDDELVEERLQMFLSNLGRRSWL